MKPLILSFFAVILGYSLLFDKKEEVSEPKSIQTVDNTVYMQETDSVIEADTVILYHNITASL